MVVPEAMRANLSIGFANRLLIGCFPPYVWYPNKHILLLCTMPTHPICPYLSL